MFDNQTLSLQETINSNFESTLNAFEAEKLKAFETSSFYEFLSEEDRATYSPVDLLQHKDFTLSLMMPGPTSVIKRMEKFYSFSNNFAFMQHRAFLVFIRRTLSACFQNFSKKLIDNLISCTALFNAFYMESVGFSS